ncbi:MAG: Wzz/FepE/Etk N-terminal domain-containing protein, partial [Chloroflexota bacterium]
MEEEIDLRPYIEALIAKWYWIVGAAVLAGVAAFIVSSLLPPTYEATALAAITQPTEIVEFDSRIRSLADSQPLKAYPEIALSDEVMLALLPEITALDAKVQSVEDLRGLLEAGAGADPSLLRLTVTHGDAETTAVIANRWAEIFVARANQIYGNKGGEQLDFFQEQLLDAESELTAAETALIEYQGRNRAAVLSNELASLQLTQAAQLEKKAQIESLTQDIESLLAQLEDGNEAMAANQLTAFLLQVRAFGGGGGGQT